MNIKRTSPTALLLLTALFISTTADAAKLYKWVDKNGKTHYSQKPPSDAGSEEVITANQPEPIPVPVESTPIEVPEPTDLIASEQAAARCQGLLHDLELYQGNGQITDREGNLMVVSTEMREAKVTEIKTELDQSCR